MKLFKKYGFPALKLVLLCIVVYYSTLIIGASSIWFVCDVMEMCR